MLLEFVLTYLCKGGVTVNKTKPGLNLLPEEYKKKLANATYTRIGIATVIIIAIIIGIFAGQLALAKIQLNSMNKEVAEINEVNSKITSLENSIKQKTEQLNSTNIEFFEFDIFMKAIYQYKPASVTIISLDSQDRLITELQTEEEAAESGEQKEDNRTEAKKAADANLEAAENKEDAEKQNSNNKATVDEEGNVISIPVEKEPITSKFIYLRGFSNSADDIANYIYKISYLDCVSDVTLTSIEERVDNTGNHTKVFELIISTTSNN